MNTRLILPTTVDECCIESSGNNPTLVICTLRLNMNRIDSFMIVVLETNAVVYRYCSKRYVDIQYVTL